MACLALTLQPIEGPDILLQTQSWFPPVRAINASRAFRSTRQLDSIGRRDSADGTHDRLGDDPLAASSGQVVVGKDHRYRVVYRLVHSVYVLGLTSADQDDTSINVFNCTRTVSQAVSVLVAACRGIDVSASKLGRRYTEVYLALDAILHGVSEARHKALVHAVQYEPASLLHPLPPAAADTEGKARGAITWNGGKPAPVDRLANVEILSQATFELPEEAYAAGDEAMATFAPPPAQRTFEKPKEETKAAASVDPFAASDRIGTAQANLAGGFARNTAAAADPVAQLAGLEVAAPQKSVAGAESQFVGEEGFEGQYGGVDWSEADAFGGLGGGLLGDDGDAWGGGLDAAEFGAAVEDSAFGGGLGGLEGDVVGPGKRLEAALAGPAPEGAPMDANFGARLAAESNAAAAAAAAAALAAQPVIFILEEMNAAFKGLSLVKLGLQGTVILRLPPGRRATSDVEFSLRLDGAAGIKQAVVKSQVASSLGKGFFHVRAPPSLQGDVPILRYRLQPRFTPVPLRIRFHTRRTEDSLSLMIQYVANPFLPAPLSNVTFIMSLPFSPASIKLSPSAHLDSLTKELRWRVPSIQPKAPPQRLRAQIPIIPEHLIYKGKEPTAEQKAAEEERKAKELAEFKVRVEFSSSGTSLSGITASAAGSTSSVFQLGENAFKALRYLCTAA